MKVRNQVAKLLAVSLLTMCGVSSVVQGVAMTFMVTSNMDTADTTPGDGICGQVTPALPVPPPNGTPAMAVAGTCTLRAAIQEANANLGDDVIDLSGINANARTITLTSSLPAITQSVRIVAPTTGTAVVINGQSATNMNTRFSALTYNDPAAGAHVYGITGPLTIQNAQNTSGGAILLTTPNSTLTLTDVTLIGNAATTGDGGAVAVAAGNTLNVIGGSFGLGTAEEANNAAGNGGAISIGDQGTLNFTGTATNIGQAGTVAANVAAGNGGGIYLGDGAKLVAGAGVLNVTNNTADNGGGIYISTINLGPTGVNDNTLANTADDVMTLTGVSMVGNRASMGNGGAIYADLRSGGDIIIADSVLGSGTAAATRNTASADGGAVWISKRLTNSDVLIRNTMITNNTAANGGGVAVKLGRIMLRNVTLNANEASAAGGGVYLDANVDNVSGGSAFIENTTLSSNRAATQGGAIAAKAGNPASSAMIYSTLAENTAAANMGGGVSVAMAPNNTFPGDINNPFNSNIFAKGATGNNCRSPFTHNDINNSGFHVADDASCGFTQPGDKQSTNPMIAALALNAASGVQTRRLLAGSPAIDAGNSMWATSKDARGADTQDGGADGDPSNSTLRRDIGAHEFGGFGLIEFRFAAPATGYAVDEDKTPVMALIDRYGVGTAASGTPSVSLASSDVTATAGADYTAVTSPDTTVSFTASGGTQFEVVRNVSIVNDAIAETAETFNLALSNPTSFADLGTRATAVVTINDAENGTFQFNPLTAMAPESADGTNDGSVSLTLTRTGGTKGRVRVTYSTGDDTCTPTPACRATAGDDYTAVTNGTVVFEAGDTSRPIQVALKNNTTAEPMEKFRVNVTAVACVDDNNAVIATPACDAQLNATPANRTATVTIMDDDGQSTLMIDSPSAMEGNSGNAPLTFTVTLIPASSQTVTVTYATANGSATTADSDYTAVAATVLTFAPGQTSRTFVVNAIGDTKFEADETFVVNLSAPTGDAVLGNMQGTGTILNDEATPAQGSIGFVDDCTTEPAKCSLQTATETGTAAASLATRTFAVRRSGNNATSTTAAVSFAVTTPNYSTFVAGTNPAACTFDATSNDYRVTAAGGGTAPNATAVTINADGTGTITFNGNGTTEALISVQVCNDTRRESLQLLNLTLSNPTSSAVVGTTAAKLTTTSDEQPRYQLTQTALTVRESDLLANFSVEAIEAVDGESVCIPYKTADGPTGSSGATSPSDYQGVDRSTGACSGALVFANGDSATKSFSVMIVDDGVAETDETFTLSLLPATGGTVLAGSDVETVTIAGLQNIYFNPKSYTSNGETGTITFEVMRSGGAGTSSAEYVITSGSGDHAATLGTDFTTTPANGMDTVSFGPGETGPKTFTVTVSADTAIEGDETFDVRLQNPMNAALVASTSTPVFVNGTIQDDDFRFEFSSATTTVDEDAMGGTLNAVLTVKRVGRSLAATSVSYGSANGTAIAGSDYTATSGTLNFAAGLDGSQTINVPIGADTVDETDENFTVSLTAPASPGVLGSPSTNTVTILDNDAEPTLKIASAAVSEGDMGSKTLSFVVTLSAASGKAVMVTATAADGTATSPNDYSSSPQMLMFPAGTTTQNFDVTINGDTLSEPNETFTVTLSNPSNAGFAAMADATATGTINTDDAQPTVTLALTGSPVAETGGTAMLTATMTAPSSQDVTVNLTYSGTATNGTDYAGASSIVIPAGATGNTASITLTATDDSTDEADETFIVDISTVTNATESGTQQVSGVITDDDGPTVSLSLTGSPLAETGGSATLTATLPQASAQDVTVELSYGGAAVNGTDYSGANRIVVPAGATSASITLAATGDAEDETDEAFTVDIATVTNGSESGTQQVSGVITDDDGPTVSLSLTGSPLAEAGGSATLTATLSGTSVQDVTVNLAYSGTATNGTDYTGGAASLVIAAGATTGSLTLTATDDATDETDETLVVDIASVTNATAADPRQVNGVITDDDGPTVSVADATSTEGSAMNFVVTLSAASAQDVTVSYMTADGTATSPADYAASSGTVTIAAGSTTATIAVPTADDTLDEADSENFTLTLSAPRNATLNDGQATGVITDNDTVSLSIADATAVTEGNPVNFVVTLSTASDREVSVAIATANGSATAGNDYTAVSRRITIPAGQTSVSTSVPTQDDSIDEADGETFTVTLSDSTNATIGRAQATASINDNDASPVLSVADVTVAEGNSGTSNAQFVVSLSGSTAQTVTVRFATANGTAMAGSDYTATSGTVSFAPGETSKTVLVPVTGDTSNEANETFTLTLSAAVNASIGRATATGTISNDDATPTLSVADATRSEGTGGSSAMTFTVTLSAASGSAVSVGYATADGTALAGSDYTATTGTLTIPAGQTSGTFSVPLSTDSSDEANETFTVTLSNPVNATLSRAQATGTIVDDDTAPASASANDGQGRSVQFSSSAGGFEGLAATSQPANAPTTLVYDNGFFTYTVAGLAAGGSATVTITLPAGSSATSYVNCPSSCTTAASGSGQTVTVNLVDGGPGDADGVANGRIVVRAGGAGRAAVGVPDPTPDPNPRNNGGGGGGSFGAGALLALASLFGLRRRKLV